MTGLELITAERQRQIEEEGWTAEHDDEHSDSELAWVAVCYAAPELVYRFDERETEIRFTDPWPNTWDECWDKRAYNEDDGTIIPNSALGVSQRILNLKKAGALLAAEIDRLQRAELEKAEKGLDGVKFPGID